MRESNPLKIVFDIIESRTHEYRTQLLFEDGRDMILAHVVDWTYLPDEEAFQFNHKDGMVTVVPDANIRLFSMWRVEDEDVPPTKFMPTEEIH